MAERIQNKRQYEIDPRFDQQRIKSTDYRYSAPKDVLYATNHHRHSRYYSNNLNGNNSSSTSSNNHNIVSQNLLPKDQQHWMITVLGGAYYEQQYLINLLQDYIADKSLIFYSISKQYDDLIFWVIGADQADTLVSLSNRVLANDGKRLMIRKHFQHIPPPVLTNSIREVLRKFIAHRYDHARKVMNLSNIANSPDILVHGLFVKIGSGGVSHFIMNTIQKNTPQLELLDLSNNQIRFCDDLLTFVQSNVHIKAIDLSHNQIYSLGELHKFKNISGLEELILENNPFIDRFSGHLAYKRAMQNIFKQLKKLDNVELFSEIGFDLGVQNTLPDTIVNHIPEQYYSFVYNFLLTYYRLFDCVNNRQSLLQRYHSEAMFTFSLSQITDLTTELVAESHNLFRIRNEKQWEDRVKPNRDGIVEFFCHRFPPTKHDPTSFQIDLPLILPTFAVIVVSGCFVIECDESKYFNDSKHTFCRTFFVIPQPDAFVITNDQLTIAKLPSSSLLSSIGINNNNVNNDKFSPLNGTTIPSYSSSSSNYTSKSSSKSSSKSLSNSSSSSSSNGILTTTILPVITSLGEDNDNNDIMMATTEENKMSTQDDAIEDFMALTKMNRKFAKLCLEENNYNIEVSFGIFQKLQSHNVIPAEAFIK